MRFSGRSLFTLFITLMLLGALYKALQWPMRASILIYFLCGICLLLALVELYAQLFSGAAENNEGSGMDTPLMEGGDISRDLLIWGWLLGLLLAIWLFGFMVSIPLFTFLFSFIHGARWHLALILAACAFGMLYGLFDMVISVPWPEPFILRIMGS